MAQDVVINGTTYPAVESVALADANGNATMYYPDAVRYVEQTLTEAQKEQARGNIGIDTYLAEELAKRGQLKPEFANDVSECTDTTKLYVLPDGYIYGYIKKATAIEHNANDGSCKLNKRTTKNAAMNDTSSTQNGNLMTPPIAVDNSWSECILTISGISTLYPVFYSPLYVYYYTADGAYVMQMPAKQLGLTDNNEANLTIPADGLSVDLALPSYNGTTVWANTAYIRIVLGLTANTAITSTSDVVKNLVINLEPLNQVVNEYGWNSTGHMFNTDNYGQAIEQNSADIEVLQREVTDLKEAVKTTPSQSGAVWYAIGDSITKGYGVTADTCWVAHVLKYNGYDPSRSLNLGISGLGFAKSDPNYNKTARMVVDENDFSEVDLVTIAIGINDWKEPFSIDTVKSEMVYCFDKILTDNPYCKIIFIAPFNIWLKGNASTNWALGYSGSDVTGGTLQNFIDTQKSVCEQYGIQIIDMTKDSVINKKNIETVLYDKVHPNAACHLAIGRELARRITFA